MYSKDQKETAVKLYIKYNKRVAPVIRELGYPDRKMIKKWYVEYLEIQNGIIKNSSRKPRFSKEQRNYAVNHYLTHGKNISDTTRQLGYPCRSILSRWLKEDVPSHKVSCLAGQSLVKYSQKEKEDAIIDLTLRDESAEEICNKRNITHTSIYKWRKSHLSSLGQEMMNTRKNKPIEVNENSKDEVLALHKEIERLKLEKDILEQAIKLIKKEKGIDILLLSNKEKTAIINALRLQYPLYMLLNALSISKSSYCYQNKVMQKDDKYKQARIKIKEIFNENYQSYGSQRIYLELRKIEIRISEKVVRRLMKEEGLFVTFVKNKKYSST